MQLDLHRIANYFRLHLVDEESKALYEMLAVNLGLDIAVEEFKVNTVFFLAEETRICSLKGQHQVEQSIILHKQIKEEILRMARLPDITSEERSKYAVVLQQILKRMCKHVLGIDIKEK